MHLTSTVIFYRNWEMISFEKLTREHEETKWKKIFE